MNRTTYETTANGKTRALHVQTPNKISKKIAEAIVRELKHHVDDAEELEEKINNCGVNISAETENIKPVHIE